MTDLVIISNYWHCPQEKSSSRYHSIASMAASYGLKVEVITSTFYHTAKKQRNVLNRMLEDSYSISFIKEKGYKKNISLQRISSHSGFANNVIKYLKSRKKPDIIYLFVPPTGLAKKVVHFAKKNQIRIITDILDLWPEAFKMIIPRFLEPLLYPMKKKIEYVYKNADNIVTVSENYLHRAYALNKRKGKSIAVYIGTELDYFDKIAAFAEPLEGKLRSVTMVYIGMLGHSYDLIEVMDAMLYLRNHGFDEVEFLVMGDGPLKEKFMSYADVHHLPVRFTGRLSYEEMVRKLVKCDFALNVLCGKAAQSIINKHADYVSAGLPVINIQQDNEFDNLLNEYNAGISCPIGDTVSLANAIKLLAADKEKRIEMGINSRCLAEKNFNRKNTYLKILNLITGKDEHIMRAVKE
ncbi:glycosyltransferase family 4 protein [Acetivibrio sp. MSJd-27]|uniref:glycosyltransferase family 4 protein n=1 Tax=Acetivibrio sp. MSJd-27 TaxID=2841523 RepID=UPI001C10ED37|nr:glycosyltransferase family 4 protein [Acetivibrio sp. MSJd-27]MBU5450132.1 glycosyltransferase family 4 protein [Acetivibrio sp. MSJd-27]